MTDETPYGTKEDDNWKPMSEMPRIIPEGKVVLAKLDPAGSDPKCPACVADKGGTSSFGQRDSLCLYHAHAEGLSTYFGEYAVIEKGGGFYDCDADGGAWLPDWWFLAGSDFEYAVNPVAFKLIEKRNDE